MNVNKCIKWIECDAGPHILIEKRLVPYWEGSKIPSNGRVIDAKFRFEDSNDSATDYDRACDIEDYIGMIPVGEGYGIVLGDDVPRSTWVPFDNGMGGFLVVLIYSDENINECLSINKLSSINDELFKPAELQFKVQDDSLYLFAACDNSVDWTYEYLEIQLKPGVYDISTIERYIFGNCAFRIHGFKLL